MPCQINIIVNVQQFLEKANIPYHSTTYMYVVYIIACHVHVHILHVHAMYMYEFLLYQ